MKGLLRWPYCACLGKGRSLSVLLCGQVVKMPGILKRTTKAGDPGSPECECE